MSSRCNQAYELAFNRAMDRLTTLRRRVHAASTRAGLETCAAAASAEAATQRMWTLPLAAHGAAPCPACGRSGLSCGRKLSLPRRAAAWGGPNNTGTAEVRTLAAAWHARTA